MANFPSCVICWQPVAQNWRVFLTGGSGDANLWRFGTIKGYQTFDDMTGVPGAWELIRQGLYAYKGAQNSISPVAASIRFELFDICYPDALTSEPERMIAIPFGHNSTMGDIADDAWHLFQSSEPVPGDPFVSRQQFETAFARFVWQEFGIDDPNETPPEFDAFIEACDDDSPYFYVRYFVRETDAKGATVAETEPQFVGDLLAVAGRPLVSLAEFRFALRAYGARLANAAFLLGHLGADYAPSITRYEITSGTGKFISGHVIVHAYGDGSAMIYLDEPMRALADI